MYLNSKSRVSIAAIIFAAFALLGCARSPCVTIVGADGKQRASVNVEIADTIQKREVGLMYRNSLDANAGMIFVFPTAAQQTFWMHNTQIPLDMIFAGDDARVLGVVENAEPYSERQLGVDGASRYVLEVNGGFARAHGISRGDVLKFSRFSPRTSE